MTPEPYPHGESEQRLALRVQRRWPLTTALGAVGIVLLLGWLIMTRGGATSLDAEWMEELVEHRSPLWEVPALAMDFLGGGWFGTFVVPLGVLAALLIFRRRWGAAYFLAATLLSAGLVQLLKHTFGRARPLEILVHSDFGSFPSGHVANAATMAVTIGVILRLRSVWIAGAAYVIAMVLSRTYLGAHWLTDTLGGLLVGAGVAVILWAPFAYRLLREGARRRTRSLAPTESRS